MNILIMLVLVVMAIGLPIFTKILIEKKYINKSSLDFTVNLFKLSVSMVSELNLKYEKELSKLTDIIILSLNYVSTETGNKQNLAVAFCLDMCIELDIEVTESRVVIITELLKMGLHDGTKK